MEDDTFGEISFRVKVVLFAEKNSVLDAWQGVEKEYASEEWK